MIFVMLAGLRCSDAFFSYRTVPVCASIKRTDGEVSPKSGVISGAVSSVSSVFCSVVSFCCLSEDSPFCSAAITFKGAARSARIISRLQTIFRVLLFIFPRNICSFFPTGYADEFAYFRLNLNTTEHTHVWDTDFTVDQTPTCTEGGRKSIHCQICNETKDEIAIPATGHSFVYHERIDATKEAQGTKAHYTCKNCAMVFDAMKNETTADSLIIPKLTEENTDQPGDGAGSTTNGTAGIPQTGDKSSMIVCSILWIN